MATFERRGKKWRVQLMHRGERFSATKDTKLEAEEWALSIQKQGGSRGGHTLKDGLEKYRDNVSPKKGGAKWERDRINAMIRDWPAVKKRMRDVTSEDIADRRDKRLKEVKPGSVRREMNLTNSVFEVARLEWKWINVNPCWDVKRPADPPPRTRKFAEDERADIIAALGFDGGEADTPDKEVAVCLLLALETTMRSGEILRIHPALQHLDQQFLQVAKTKNGEPKDVPLSKRAVELIKLLPGRKFSITDSYRDSAYRRVRDDLGIKNLRFHDSKRTATTRLARKLSPQELSKVTGNKNMKVLINTYYSPEATELAQKMD